MRTFPILYFLGLLTLALAISIPSGAIDGVYIAGRDNNGQETHARLRHSITKSINTSTFDPTDVGEVWCHCDLTVNNDETTEAVGMLQRQLASTKTLAPHMTLYSINGNAIAYFCNTANSMSFHVSVKDAYNGNLKVKQWCRGHDDREYRAGSTRMWDGDGGGLNFGYLPFSNGGNDICGNSENSDQHSCLDQRG